MKNKITNIAIGGFDGMHLAHQEVFKYLDDNGGIVVIESGYANLTPKTYRAKFTKLPIFYYPLQNIKHLDGIEFIRLLKEEFCNLCKIVVGYDFRFGKDAKYSAYDLKKLFDKDVIIVKEFRLDGVSVHSRVIRSYLRDGNIKNDGIHPSVVFNFGPIRVPEKEYFMMGDNRDHSNDSRFWGTVPYSLIVGKPWFVYFSWDDNYEIRWNRVGKSVETLEKELNN